MKESRPRAGLQLCIEVTTHIPFVEINPRHGVTALGFFKRPDTTPHDERPP
jgi:hypothetical protein